jgi:hypothetical protein
MKMSLNINLILVIGISVLFFGCDKEETTADPNAGNRTDQCCQVDVIEDPTGNAQATPLTHTQAHELIVSQVETHALNFKDRLSYLDGDRRLIEALDSFFAGSEESCYENYNEELDTWEEICENSDNSDDEEVDAIDLGFFDEYGDLSQSIIDELDESFLVADASNLTYALPESICDIEEDSESTDNDEFPEFEEEELTSEQDREICLTLLRDFQPQLVLEGYGDGLKISFNINTDNQFVAVVSGVITSDYAKLTLNLDLIMDIVKTGFEEEQRITENEDTFELPNVSGEVSLSMLMETQKMSFNFNIDRAIQIAGRFIDEETDLSINIPTAVPLFAAISDATNTNEPSIAFNLNLPALIQELSTRLQFADENEDDDYYDYDDYPEMEPLPEEEEGQSEGPIRQIKLDIGGVNLGLKLTLKDVIQLLITAGLGDQTTRLSIDNQEALSIDINPQQGRRIQISFDQNQTNDDIFSFELAQLSTLIQIKTNFTGFDEMELPTDLIKDLFSIQFDALGQTEVFPKVSISNEGVRIDEGRLQIQAQDAMKSMTMEGGQCLGDESDEEGDFSDEEGDFSDEEGDFSEENIDNEQMHFLEEIQIRACMEL